MGAPSLHWMLVMASAPAAAARTACEREVGDGKRAADTAPMARGRGGLRIGAVGTGGGRDVTGQDFGNDGFGGGDGDGAGGKRHRALERRGLDHIVFQLAAARQDPRLDVVDRGSVGTGSR